MANGRIGFNTTTDGPARNIPYVTIAARTQTALLMQKDCMFELTIFTSRAHTWMVVKNIFPVSVCLYVCVSTFIIVHHVSLDLCCLNGKKVTGSDATAIFVSFDKIW